MVYDLRRMCLQKTTPKKSHCNHTKIATDIQGLYPVSNRQKRYILVVCYYFSKWIQAILLKQIDAKYVAQKLIDKFISIFGTPLELFSDRGSNFESELFKEMCDLSGTHKTRTTVGRSSSDGLVERINRVIQNMLSAFVQKDHREWCTHWPTTQVYIAALVSPRH
ncbi:POL-like protein [Mya arenaria]|uniref:POL-like protein n=1 Tax=Mya arenaria TaxID=6604 RepID=A0ABY7ECE3_MYAAR|nr:POL-like protein [Mya arenaria]